MKKNTILVPLMCCHSGGMFFSPRRAEGCAGVPARVARKLSPFTLIELVVTIAIIVLTVAIVSAVFREESPARALENAENDFRAYCGRVRYRACETGRDWVINYDPEKKQFTASPGKFEKFQMPGGEGQAGPVPDDEEPDPDDPENESGSENGYSRLVWSLPEKFVFTPIPLAMADYL